MRLVFLMADLDSDGGVSLSSMRELLKMVEAQQQQQQQQQEEVDEFADVDAIALRTPGGTRLDTSSTERLDVSLEALFARYDGDGDRLLSFDEFSRFLENNAAVLEGSVGLAQARLGATGIDLVAQTCEELKKERVRRLSKTSTEIATSSTPAA